MVSLKPQGHRARIIRVAAREPVTLTDICRQTKPHTRRGERDASVQRLKINAALQTLAADGLITRTPHGWRATAAGREAAGIE